MEKTMRFAVLTGAGLTLAILASVSLSADKKDPYAEHVASTVARTPEEERKAFHLPPGFDGWVYACHGYSNTSTVQAADGSRVTMQSGNTYRMRLDGSHIEQFTHGQVNPFGLCFDPLGNLYSSDCHTQPIYQLLRGAWYPSFG